MQTFAQILRNRPHMHRAAHRHATPLASLRLVAKGSPAVPWVDAKDALETIYHAQPTQPKTEKAWAIHAEREAEFNRLDEEAN